MAIIVVWIDRENAKLFQLSSDRMERMSPLAARHQDHHTHRTDAFDYKHRENAFFLDVIQHFQTAAASAPSIMPKILIVGPGVAKHHFLNYMNEHHPVSAKKVVGCEAVDHPTDAQIAALARKFFHLPVFSSAD